MKNEQLKKLIKEEIKKILKEKPDQIMQPNGQEKISGGGFNQEVTEFLRNLKINKLGIDNRELKNLLDLFKKVLQKAREGTLSQTIEDRIIKALMLKSDLSDQPEI